MNQKACCGDVELEPTTLQPGEDTTLAVTIRAGESAGSLSHLAVVETDHPEAPALEFWTLATVHPRFRIETDRESPSPGRLFPHQSAQARFVVFAYGTSDDPPLALDETTLRSSLDVEWDGPAREQTAAGPLLEQSRRLVVTLKADANPGPRADEVLVLDGEQVVLRHPLRWEVSPAVTASPSGVTVTSTSRSRENRVVLRAQDGRDFQVTGIDVSLPGITVEADETRLAPIHTIPVTVQPESGNAGRAGEITIATTHPAQPTVTITVFVSAGALATSSQEVSP